MKETILFLILLWISGSSGSDILMITLGGTKSHKIPFLEIGKGLTERLHKVTLISGFKTEIETSSSIDDVAPLKVVQFIKTYFNRDLLGTRMKGELPIPILEVFRYPLEVCSAFYDDPEVAEIIALRKFDLAILDGAFPECALAMVHKMKMPFMFLNTVGLYMGSLSRAGNPVLPAFTPAFSGQFTEHMSFFERFTNNAVHLTLNMMHFVMVHFLQKRLRNYFGSDLPHVYEISSNVSFTLNNGHPSMTYSRPFFPNVAEIACVHCKEPKRLPHDLEDFVGGNSSEGFIYVAMGSSVKAANMPNKLRRIMLEAFTHLPYKVLWKWETNTKSMKNIPNHIKLSKWFPQQDILGHKNIKSFVTHGGLLSMFETVYHGCPIVTIPVFCDHDANAAKAVLDGYAIKLNLQTLSSRTLATAIEQTIKNSTYKKNALYRQSLLRDQINSPLNLSIYWIEYVIKYKGADHLKTPSRALSFAEYYSLDVCVFCFGLLWSIRRMFVWYQGIIIKIKIKMD